MAKSKPGKMFAILSRCQRTGRWRLASRFSVLALLGTCRLDLHGALVEGDRSRVKITVVLGSATVILPRGAEVRPSGLSLLSISSVDVPENGEKSDLPPIEIDWTSILGRIRVGVEPEPEAEVSAVRSSEPAVKESPPAGVGFADLEPEPETTDASTGVGFEDLEPEAAAEPDTQQTDAQDLEPEAVEPETTTTGVGFEDLEPEAVEPETTTTGVGFEDLEPEPDAEPEAEADTQKTETQDTETETTESETTSASLVGFEDLEADTQDAGSDTTDTDTSVPEPA